MSFQCEECHLGNPVTDYSLFALHRMCNLESLIETSKRRELASCLLLHSSIATRTRVSAGEVIKGNTGVNSRVTRKAEQAVALPQFRIRIPACRKFAPDRIGEQRLLREGHNKTPRITSVTSGSGHLRPVSGLASICPIASRSPRHASPGARTPLALEPRVSSIARFPAPPE